MKVLVVDDDPAICNMLRIFLSAKGHQVDTYLNPTNTPMIQGGESGCPQGSHCADALLVDYFMPKMNGLEFLRLLEERGCGAIKGNKAIITAYGTYELCQELERLGVKYFKKPFRFPEISRWLDECSARATQAGAALN